LDRRTGEESRPKRSFLFHSAAMAEPEGGAQRPPPRPAIALPSRSSMESLFRPADVSPGLSSLLADPDLEYPSFSQLLAGAIGPLASAPPPFWHEARRESGGGANEVALSLGQSRPVNLTATRLPLITFPPGISPSSLFQSPPSLFSPQNQPQATVQAARSHAYDPTSYSSTLSAAPATTAVASLRHLPTPFNLSSAQQMTQYNSTSESAHGDRRSQPSTLVVDKPADDGYNWRKYGQKQVKGGEYPRSYYKCTHQKCPVKKKVERSFDGQVTEIVYKGQHNHQPPQQNRHAKEGGSLASGSNGSKPEPASQGLYESFGKSSETTYKRNLESDHDSSKYISDSSDDEVAGEIAMRTDELGENQPDLKRRKMDIRNNQSASYCTVTEPKVIFQTTSEVDLLDDGYRWRKYGQKVVKGNPHPRSYYKCTNSGCNVRKHVERASTDPKAVITTYEGKHNHDVPAARSSNHSMLNANASASIISPNTLHNYSRNQISLGSTDLGHNIERPVAIQLKKERDGV
ncbi:unnamed protein product, partial [Musa banksii]